MVECLTKQPFQRQACAFKYPPTGLGQWQTPVWISSHSQRRGCKNLWSGISWHVEGSKVKMRDFEELSLCLSLTTWFSCQSWRFISGTTAENFLLRNLLQTASYLGVRPSVVCFQNQRKNNAIDSVPTSKTEFRLFPMLTLTYRSTHDTPTWPPGRQHLRA